MLFIASHHGLIMVILCGGREILCLSLIFVPFDKIPKIKICNNFARKHPEAIRSNLIFIAMEIIEPD